MTSIAYEWSVIGTHQRGRHGVQGVGGGVAVDGAEGGGDDRPSRHLRGNLAPHVVNEREL